MRYINRKHQISLVRMPQVTVHVFTLRINPCELRKEDWVERQTVGKETEWGRSWLQVQQHPEVSLARQVEARLWRVQSDILWS